MVAEAHIEEVIKTEVAIVVAIKIITIKVAEVATIKEEADTTKEAMINITNIIITTMIKKIAVNNKIATEEVEEATKEVAEVATEVIEEDMFLMLEYQISEEI